MGDMTAVAIPSSKTAIGIPQNITMTIMLAGLWAAFLYILKHRGNKCFFL